MSSKMTLIYYTAIVQTARDLARKKLLPIMIAYFTT